MAIEKGRVLSVRELNLAAKQLIEGGLPLLWVRGEISNFVSAASGHWYFSLKDEAAQVRCVMFRHKSQYLDFKPANGMQVEVLALATLYEARGDFQLTLEKMRPAGLGALYEAFERLKAKLEGEGLFDAERKRDLPLLPKQIGIVTSLQAAALRDVLRTLANRMPSVPVLLYPVPVQGEGAGQKIAQAIRTASQRAECDVLIVCRGGGSIEDLWAFNEEVVARAIAASHIPVVSGVGHETDFTIADFVADLRAATPTAAAQAVVPDRAGIAPAPGAAAPASATCGHAPVRAAHAAGGLSAAAAGAPRAAHPAAIGGVERVAAAPAAFPGQCGATAAMALERAVAAGARDASGHPAAARTAGEPGAPSECRDAAHAGSP